MANADTIVNNNNENDSHPVTRPMNDNDQKEDSPEAPIPTQPAHMHEVIPGLFLGDYSASQNFDDLRKHGISHIISAMRARYSVPTDFTLHRILIDDNARTNIVRYFAECNASIENALKQGKGVLVHCYAGVSRSTTLVAAYLMKSHELTVDDAIEKITSVRPVVDPIEFFLHQLEMYERCACDSNMENHMEYRRFLMAFNHAEMMDGDGVDELYLAYYPSPAPSPRRRSSDPFNSLLMTPVKPPDNLPIPSTAVTSEESSTCTTPAPAPDGASAGSVSVSVSGSGSGAEVDVSSERAYAQRTRRLSREGSERVSEKLARLAMSDAHKIPSFAEYKGKENVIKLGVGNVVARGRRLRCKMCRRELALREHILNHEPGRGQEAFAIHRRDMTQYRQEQEAKRAKQQKDMATESATTTAAAATQTQPLAQPIPTTTEPPKYEKREYPRPAPTPQPKTQMAARAPPGLRVSLPPNVIHMRNGRYDPPADESAIDTSPLSPPTQQRSNSPPLLPNQTCNSYFTEPLSWMSEQLSEGQLNGRIVCPNSKCGAKLGTFDWAGQQCSCGAWVTPAFSISASKVDEVV